MKGPEAHDAEQCVDWKKLYLELEEKMNQFRIQVKSIRSKISTKMEELNEKLEQTELRALESEHQLRVLEANAEEQPDAIEAAKTFRSAKITELEKKLAIQIERNIELEKELSYERDQRNIDKQLLQEKAIKIKEWVTKTLKKSEREKADMERSIKKLNAALKSMQSRAQGLLCISHFFMVS
jgi:hypothetical protein